MVPVSTRPFRWQDSERVVLFGRGALAAAGEELGDGFTLLTTERGRDMAPELAGLAAAVHLVPSGRVDDVAGDLLDAVGDAPRLVALGGGRVIDTGKALAGARGGTVAAIPTTLSGAEMTWLHRFARGAPDGSRFVRPSVVVNDPALSASQPAAARAASAGNALGHVAEAPLTPRANPVSTLASHAAGPLLLEEDPDAIALGALLAGYAMDGSWYGLHHVLAQTLAREGGAGHGPANTVLLPATLAALRGRFTDELAALDIALGRSAEEAAVTLRERAGLAGVRDLGVERGALGRCADAAAARPELAHTPPPAEREEILALYESSW